MHVNGIPIKREILDDKMPHHKGEEVGNIYLETLDNNVQYQTLEVNKFHKLDFPRTTAVFTIPEKKYFFMGDNRENSIDSRFNSEIGIIDENLLIGRADFIIWSKDASIFRLKLGRAFSSIQIN